MPTIYKPKRKSKKKTGKSIEINRIYASLGWTSLRDWYRMEHPFCEACLRLVEKGELEAPMWTEEVHHKIPISTGKDFESMERLALDPENLMSLCKEHHHQIHKEMRRRG